MRPTVRFLMPVAVTLVGYNLLHAEGTAGHRDTDSATRKPLIVMVEASPGRMANPTFVMYDDGLVIFDHEGGYRSLVLDESGLGAMQAGLRILTQLPRSIPYLHWTVAGLAWSHPPMR